MEKLPIGQSGKTSKPAFAAGRYFKYAFGEIILVVFGILIALQINNWNEVEKDRAYEVKMLKELSIAIKNDISYTLNHTLGYRTSETEKSIHFFKRLYKKEKVDIDSLWRYFNWTTYGVSFQINEGPYQGIKSVGLDKISNDSLRNKIQLTYDFLIKRNKQLIEWGETNYDEKQEPLKKLFYKETLYKNENNKIEFYKPLKEGEIWEDPKFIELISLTEFRINWRRNHFEAVVDDLKELKDMIDKELSQ